MISGLRNGQQQLVNLTLRHQQQQVRHASFSLPSIRSLFQRKQPSEEQEQAPSQSTEAKHETEAGKGLFDIAQESDQLSKLTNQWQDERRSRKATFHKSSTANFKTSKRKLNDLSRLIAGRTADEGILQLQMSPKKQASRLLAMVALARDHALAKGMDRSKLVIAQSWVSQGPSLPRVDIKGRGRRGIKHHPSSKLHVLLAEGQTEEELRREKKREQWRMSIRGLSERDGTGVGKARPLINVGVGGWKW
ncbi:ribosomal protein L22 [Meredithblackwellia eburnea MCA 4105]